MEIPPRAILAVTAHLMEFKWRMDGFLSVGVAGQPTTCVAVLIQENNR
jgi:hypothetical protein